MRVQGGSREAWGRRRRGIDVPPQPGRLPCAGVGGGATGGGGGGGGVGCQARGGPAAGGGAAAGVDGDGERTVGGAGAGAGRGGRPGWHGLSRTDPPGRAPSASARPSAAAAGAGGAGGVRPNGRTAAAAAAAASAGAGFGPWLRACPVGLRSRAPPRVARVRRVVRQAQHPGGVVPARERGPGRRHGPGHGDAGHGRHAPLLGRGHGARRPLPDDVPDEPGHGVGSSRHVAGGGGPGRPRAHALLPPAGCHGAHAHHAAPGRAAHDAPGAAHDGDALRVLPGHAHQHGPRPLGRLLAADGPGAGARPRPRAPPGANAGGEALMGRPPLWWTSLQPPRLSLLRAWRAFGMSQGAPAPASCLPLRLARSPGVATAVDRRAPPALRLPTSVVSVSAPLAT